MRVIAVNISFRRLVERAHEKIRQASGGMPAVMIRQLDVLTRVMPHTISAEQREVLQEQATMIMRVCEETVLEEKDRADVERRYERVLAAAEAAAAQPAR